MKPVWRTTLILIFALPLLGALAGRLAAPGLARLNYIVRVAEHVWRDEQRTQAGVKKSEAEEEDKEVKAFRETGMPAAQLYAQAREARTQFAAGSTWFGAWCGLVAALKIAATLRGRRRREYDADPAHCLACARCYLSCPVERERLEQGLGERPL